MNGKAVMKIPGSRSARKTAMAAFAVCLSVLLSVLPSCSHEEEYTKRSDGYRNYYEIFVRSFYDSDGDGIGDLAGVTAKLDYISKDLGADGIWLMPIMPSPSYHKYDITDYRNIDPQYGTLDDFATLIAEAHKRDIRVILDLVLNHTSSKHPWFTEAVKALWTGADSPTIDYYHFTTENPGQGYSMITDKYYYECRFWSGMPDLNLDNESLRAEIAGIAAFWLDKGADGFRLDACTSFYTGNNTKNIEFLSWLNGVVKAHKPDAYLVGEVWSDAGTVADYYQSGIDSFFNFPYATATGKIAAAINGSGGSSWASGLEAWNRTIRENGAVAVDALFLSNHDNGRSAGFLMRDPVREKMAAALYLLAPGDPFIYYGEEIGMTGSGEDPNKRLPMLWSLSDITGITDPPPGATQKVEGIDGVQEQIADRGSLLNYYKKILTVKAKNPEIARGEMHALDTGIGGVAAFTSSFEGKTVYVLHNLSGEEQKISLSGSGLAGLALSDSLTTGKKSPRIAGEYLVLPSMSTAILR